MLQLKKITKTYKTGEFVQHALKDLSLEFRTNEFVAVLGHSGSGKTTLLNIVGGLDRYDSGDLIINGQSTKGFKDQTWDSYRNNSVGFVFQSYNLITHISVQQNIEMSMTLSGVSKEERRNKTTEVLKRVGLLEHANKKPNQLSGGQMQRVAIARALVNDPDIILADEPTGALDSKTSIQIMELIKEIAKDKLVIMVTHNPNLANQFANRIITLKDGEVVDDSNPIEETKEQENVYSFKKTAMSFLTALKLSFNNIKTKKGRTVLISAASSIGIIGIALILSLSNGFQMQIDQFESNTLSSMPILISKQNVSMVEVSTTMSEHNDLPLFPDGEKIIPYANVMETIIQTNNITDEYIDYIKELDTDLLSGILFKRSAKVNLLTKDNKDDKYQFVNNLYVDMLPTDFDDDPKNVTGVSEVLKGEITDEPSLVLMLDAKNQVAEELLNSLGLSGDDLTFDDILNQPIKLVLNDELYRSFGNSFVMENDFKKLYENDRTIDVKISAIIRYREDREDLATFSTSYLLFNEQLLDLIVENNKDSKIIKAQERVNYNILTSEPFVESTSSVAFQMGQGETKESILESLGADVVPTNISIYPKNFDSKDEIVEYLDKYNEGKEEKDQINYTDQAGLITSLSSNIMGAITIVLIAFSSIALIVSSIMIGVITYISVIERTKEIGILRALGARKKDITRVFNAETFIIGIFSGLLGVVVTYILIVPVNIILKDLTGLTGVANLNIYHAIILIAVSLTLTLLGGFIPSKLAAKKDPVEALRTE